MRPMAQIEIVLDAAFQANINITDDELEDAVENDDECKKYTAAQVRRAVEEFRSKHPGITTNIPGLKKYLNGG